MRNFYLTYRAPEFINMEVALRVNLYHKYYAADGKKVSAGIVRDNAGKVRDSVRDVTDDKIDFSKLMESMTKQEKNYIGCHKNNGRKEESALRHTR